MVIAELTRQVAEIIKNSESPMLEAEYIVMAALGADRTNYLLRRMEAADEKMQVSALEMATRRAKGEPLAYILGNSEFMGLRFCVSRDTLIPRQDSEALAELAISKIGNSRKKVLDIGTGTGCIGISIAHFCSRAEVTLLDISHEALKIAAKNAKLNGAAVETIQCDILSSIPDGLFDAVVSNPPYIITDVIPTLQTEVKAHEPVIALDGGEDGLIFYRRITELSAKILNAGGLLAFEIGYDQRDEVMDIMRDYNNVACIKDLCGNDRVIYGIKAS